MRKFKAPVNTGGIPLHGERLNDELGSEIWDPIQALLSRFDSDVEGIIVKGCVLSANGGNFDISAGIVYLNGEFMRLAAATNVPFTRYIAPAAPTMIQKVFADAVSKDLIESKTAEIVNSAPGAGQYITIPSLTPRRRLATDNRLDAIQLIVDGGGTAIVAGAQGFIVIPYDCVIEKVQLLADVAGSMVADLWVDTYANFPPTIADKITASAPPTLTAAQKSEDATLTGWTKTLVRGSIIGYQVTSASTVARVTINLMVLK